MRLTTLFRKLLGVTSLFVEDVNLCDAEELLISVRPSTRVSRCGLCGRKCPRYDRLGPRKWRHLGLGSLKIYFVYSPHRISCGTCGVRVESVPWAAHASGFTLEFEEHAAYLSQITNKTAVTKLLGISWHTVGAIIERVVSRNIDPNRLKNLRNIGIDEFSYRRRQKYITIVVDHDRRRIVWATRGHNKQSLKKFFESIGEEATANIENITIDMSQAYIRAIEECAPEANVVFDRFHVQRLASDALDRVRRDLLRELRGTPEGRQIFNSRFVLLKNNWSLSRAEDQKLSEIQNNNARLYRAYLLKESLAQALDYKQPWRARKALLEWLSWASRSKLAPFVKVARTIRENFDGVLAYVEHRLTNGLTEGLNNLARVIARRAFGFHGHESLISMLFLCCGGIELNPPLPTAHRK